MVKSLRDFMDCPTLLSTFRAGILSEGSIRHPLGKYRAGSQFSKLRGILRAGDNQFRAVSTETDQQMLAYTGGGWYIRWFDDFRFNFNFVCQQVDWINDYHVKCLEFVGDYITNPDNEYENVPNVITWLEEQTKPIVLSCSDCE